MHFPLMRQLLREKEVLSPQMFGQELFALPGLVQKSYGLLDVQKNRNIDPCNRNMQQYTDSFDLQIQQESDCIGGFFDLPIDGELNSPLEQSDAGVEDGDQSVGLRGTWKPSVNHRNMIASPFDLDVSTGSSRFFDMRIGNSMVLEPSPLDYFFANTKSDGFNNATVKTEIATTTMTKTPSLSAIADIIHSALLVLQGVPSELFFLCAFSSSRDGKLKVFPPTTKKNLNRKLILSQKILKKRIIAGKLSGASSITKMLETFARLGSMIHRLEAMCNKLTTGPPTFAQFGQAVYSELREFNTDLQGFHKQYEKTEDSGKCKNSFARSLFAIESRLLRDKKWLHRIPVLAQFCGVRDNCKPSLPKSGAILLDQLHRWCERDVENALQNSCQKIFRETSQPLLESMREWANNEVSINGPSDDTSDKDMPLKQLNEFILQREASNGGNDADLWRHYLSSVQLNIPQFVAFGNQLKLVGCLKKLFAESRKQGQAGVELLEYPRSVASEVFEVETTKPKSKSADDKRRRRSRSRSKGIGHRKKSSGRERSREKRHEPQKRRGRKRQAGSSQSRNLFDYDSDVEFQELCMTSTTRRTQTREQKTFKLVNGFKSKIVETDIHTMKKKEETIVTEFSEIMDQKTSVIKKNYVRRKFGNDEDFAVHNKHSKKNLNLKEQSDEILQAKGGQRLPSLEDNNHIINNPNASLSPPHVNAAFNAKMKDDPQKEFLSFCTQPEMPSTFGDFSMFGGFDSNPFGSTNFFGSLIPNDLESTRCSDPDLESSSVKSSMKVSETPARSEKKTARSVLSTSNLSSNESAGGQTDSSWTSNDDEVSEWSSDDGSNIYCEEYSNCGSDNDERNLTIREKNQQYERRRQSLQKKMLDKQIREKVEAKTREEIEPSNLRKLALQNDDNAANGEQGDEVANLLGQKLKPIVEEDDAHGEYRTTQYVAKNQYAFGTHDYYVNLMAEDYRNHMAQVENESRLLEWKLQRMQLQEERERLFVELEIRDKLAVQDLIDDRRKMLERLDKYGTGGKNISKVHELADQNMEPIYKQSNEVEEKVTLENDTDEKADENEPSPKKTEQNPSSPKSTEQNEEQTKGQNPTTTEDRNKATSEGANKTSLEASEVPLLPTCATGLKIKRVSAKRISMSALKKARDEMVPHTISEPIMDQILKSASPMKSKRHSGEDLLVSPENSQNPENPKRRELIDDFHAFQIQKDDHFQNKLSIPNILPRFIPRWRCRGVANWLDRGVQWEYDFGERDPQFGIMTQPEIPKRHDLPIVTKYERNLLTTRDERIEMLKELPAAGLRVSNEGLSIVGNEVQARSETQIAQSNEVRTSDSRTTERMLYHAESSQKTEWTTSNIFSSQFRNFLSLKTKVSASTGENEGDKGVMADWFILNLTARDTLQQVYGKCVTSLVESERREQEKQQKRELLQKMKQEKEKKPEQANEAEKSEIKSETSSKKKTLIDMFFDPVTSETECSSSSSSDMERSGRGRPKSPKKPRKRKFKSIYPKAKLAVVYEKYPYLNPKCLKKFRPFSLVTHTQLLRNTFGEGQLKGKQMAGKPRQEKGTVVNHAKGHEVVMPIPSNSFSRHSSQDSALLLSLPAFFKELHLCLSYEMDDYARNLVEHEEEILSIPTIVSALLPDRCKQLYSLDITGDEDGNKVNTFACLHDVLTESKLVFHSGDRKQHTNQRKLNDTNTDIPLLLQNRLHKTFLSTTHHTPIFSYVFKLMTQLKCSMQILREIWLWLYKTNISMAYVDILPKYGNAESVDLSRINMPVSFSKSGTQRSLLHVVYIKLGVLRHHMQHFATFLGQYLQHDVLEKTWSQFHARVDRLFESVRRKNTNATASTAANSSHNSDTIALFLNLLYNIYEKELISSLRKLTWYDSTEARDSVFVLIRLISELRDTLWRIKSELDWINPTTLHSLKHIDSEFHKNKKILQREMKKSNLRGGEFRVNFTF